MNLGDRIRDLRWDARLTQTELARRVGIHKNSMSEIERGIATPRVETLRRIANALGVTMDELYEEPSLKAGAPEEGRPGLLERTAYLLREQDRLYAEDARRALETGKSQADFAHAENRAMTHLLNTEHDVLAAAYIEAVRTLMNLQENLPEQRDPERFLEILKETFGGARQTTTNQ
jgi:transcriptional regulator with XRE-family HTH domain